MIDARFDDLTPGAERSFRLTEPQDGLVARSAAEVPDAIERAERTARAGRWVAGFLAYEAAPGLDPSLEVRRRPAGDVFSRLPLAWFGVFGGREPLPPLVPPAGEPEATPAWALDADYGQYERIVHRIRELIAAGQTYQVNHTLRMRAELRNRPDELYRDLALGQRGRFSAALRLPGFRVLSASPELFFRWEAGRVLARPMKGTIARGRWPAEDEEAARTLATSAKDRAENAMIVDLLRNDIGRVAVPGSVRAERLFDLERYETVWQMTSTISARTRPGTTLVDLLRALFPSGSVTGAPKVAAMRAIAELEDSPRGVYTGAIGYLAPGREDHPRTVFGVAIRTVVLDEASGTAEYGVGGGITFDSSARREFEEVRAKTRVLTARPPAFDLFETLRYEPRRGFADLEEHLGRIAASARYFAFRFDPEQARTALEKAAADATGPARVRLTLSREGELRTGISDLPRGAAPVRLALSAEPVDPADVWLYHKTTNRAGYERRRALRGDVDDVLLVNTRGEVTESPVANVAIGRGGEWWTPPVEAGLLPGTRRAVLLRQGRIREATIRAEELTPRTPIALLSSVRGWRPAVLVAAPR